MQEGSNGIGYGQVPKESRFVGPHFEHPAPDKKDQEIMDTDGVQVHHSKIVFT